MSETEVWQDRAATLTGWIGSPVGGLIFAAVAASLLVDCSDIDLQLQQTECLARVRVAALNDPTAIILGFLLGVALALALAGVFHIIGARADERIRREESRRLTESLAAVDPVAPSSTADTPTESTDELQRWLVASARAAEAKAVEDARRERARADQSGANQDQRDRERFLDY